jgi:hypothetical protein
MLKVRCGSLGLGPATAAPFVATCCRYLFVATLSLTPRSAEDAPHQRKDSMCTDLGCVLGARILHSAQLSFGSSSDLEYTSKRVVIS